MPLIMKIDLPDKLSLKKNQTNRVGCHLYISVSVFVPVLIHYLFQGCPILSAKGQWWCRFSFHWNRSHIWFHLFLLGWNENLQTHQPCPDKIGHKIDCCLQKKELWVISKCIFSLALFFQDYNEVIIICA